MVKKFFLLEIGIVLCIGITILLILHFLNIVSFSSLNPLVVFNTAQQPRETSQDVIPKAPVKPSDSTQKTITGKSNNTQYNLEILNTADFIKLLTEWGFYDRAQPDNATKNITFVNNLVISLSPTELAYNKVSSPGMGVYLASDFSVPESGIGELSIYIAPEVLSDTTKNPNDYMTYEALSSLYSMSKPVTSLAETEARNEALKKELETLRKSGVQFFSITKK